MPRLFLPLKTLVTTVTARDQTDLQLSWDYFDEELVSSELFCEETLGKVNGFEIDTVFGRKRHLAFMEEQEIT